MGRWRDNESGFTIVEVLVAIMILSIGAMTTFTLLSSATRNAQRAKGSQVALEYAEQELEYLRSMTSEELALTQLPHTSTNALNPNYRYRDSDGTFALQRQPLGDYHDLVVNEDPLYGGGEVEGGKVEPGPTPFTSGDVQGKVFRYVVWRNDAKCSEENCPGKQDYKQIVVAVKVDSRANEAGERGYFEVQSNFVDPTDNPEHDPVANSSGNVVTAQQFFLTDTPCSASGATTRQAITGNHLLHNTLGTCASGLQTGTTPGAPDTLLLGSPPIGEGEELPPEYDYSNDTYLDTTPDAGTGLQIRKDDTPECHFTPKGTSNPESQIHRWVTDPMAEEFKMIEKATLQFYTESINGSSGSGTACIYLYRWKDGGQPELLTNTMDAKEYWSFTPLNNADWPSEWEKVRKTMTFNGSPVTINAGERLGLALSVERANTQGDALSFMYDHPKYAGRLEVDTSTPLEGE